MSELAVNSPKVNLPTIKNITYQENRELCRSSAVVELKFQLAVNSACGQIQIVVNLLAVKKKPYLENREQCRSD